ncbi:MAG TPA: Gfo/Idh/MocA family oxidoreductase [Bauldia sp.]|nr:Gfo/Idh/MocA family oxidoreductase [Bauldia sp.]
MTTRLLILGTGAMARSHATAFAAEPDIEIVAAVEPDKKRLAAFAKEFGIRKRFADLDAALDWGRFDAATNVTPDAVHHPTTMKLIAAGKHVLCEKPLATVYPLALEMADAAEKAGLINMVNLTYRASPALQRAREWVKSGRIGNLRHFEASYLQSWLVSRHWGDWRTGPQWLWRLSTKHGSNGVVGDIGIHIIDFASFGAASDVVSLASRVKTFHKAPGDQIGEYRLDANDSFAMTAELANGAIGTIQATRFATGNSNELRLSLYGDAGALRVHTNGKVSSLEICAGADIEKQIWRKVRCPPAPTTFHRFAQALSAGKNGDPDFRRAADIQRVLDLALESGKTGKTITIV